MNKSPTKHKIQGTTRKQVKVSHEDCTRTHRMTNWIISVVLLVFALWSIYLNTQARSFFNQATQVYSETEKRITDVTSGLSEIKDVCQSAVIVQPVTTTDTQTKP